MMNQPLNAKAIITGTLLSLAILVQACKCDCKFPGMGIVFTGFDAAATKAVVVRRYIPNSDWSQLTATDTLDATHGISIGFNFSDYRIELPAAGRTFQITDVHQEKRRESKGGIFNECEECYNEIHYKVDGVAGSGRPPSGMGYGQMVNIELKK